MVVMVVLSSKEEASWSELVRWWGLGCCGPPPRATIWKKCFHAVCAPNRALGFGPPPPTTAPLLFAPFPMVGVGGMGPPILGTSWTFRVVAGGIVDFADGDDEAPAAAPLFGLDITG